jgi:hypothetical protein
VFHVSQLKEAPPSDQQVCATLPDLSFSHMIPEKVLSEGEIKVSDKITLRCVALVQSLGYNLLSVS